MVDVLSCMREVELLIARRAPFDEVVAMIDTCLAAPGSEAYRPSIERYRVTAYSYYGRPLDECVPVIDGYLALQPSLPARASAVLAACGERPELAPRYLDAMLAELERAARIAPDDAVLDNVLQGAYRVRHRVTGGRPIAVAERVLTVDEERREGEERRIVHVMVYTPQPDRRAGGWECELWIRGALHVRDEAHGTDSLEALKNALMRIDDVLARSDLAFK